VSGEHATLLSIFLLGLFSAPHCAGMCGGIVAALSIKAASHDVYHALRASAFYNFGRISMYVLLGVVFGMLSLSMQNLVPEISVVLRVAAGVLLVAMGLYISGWWFGLRQLESLGYRLFKPIQNIQSMQWQLPQPIKLFITGMLWGCLPCGLVYSMLTMAMTAATVLDAGLIMFVFGLGTIPVLLLTGAFSNRMMLLVKQKYVRTVMGVLIILFGIWTLFAIVDKSAHQGHQAMQMSR